MAATAILCPLVGSVDVKDPQFDGVVVVTDNFSKLTGNLQCLQPALKQYQELDISCEKCVNLLPFSEIPSKRLIFSGTGPLNRDYDDVRRFYEAACDGIKRALKAGCRSPLLVRPVDDSYPMAGRVAALGALHAIYVPLEVREADESRVTKVDKLGIWCTDLAGVNAELPILMSLEVARIVARDIGGSDPERMAAPRVAEYIQEVFSGTPIKVEVLSGAELFQREYPCLAAVNRAASLVDRHQGRVIFLEYVGEGPIDTTLLLVGKGITYDTGGADIKAGGVMAGMHRDKCGAAAVGGFFQVLANYRPKGLKVIGAMAVVRNSVGSQCYVSDEIIKSRAGVRLRVGNTDAEGRMAMVDVLCHMKEKAQTEVNPHLFTWATLTGHVIRAFSDAYTAIMENGPARKAKLAQKLQEAGDLSADPFEISTIRREDFEANAAPSEYEDIVQANNKPSTMTDRGHQLPAAFMIVTSGLDKHGSDSAKPLPYCHVDVAGSSGPFPGVPTGAPIVAFAHAFVLNRESGAK